MCSVWLLRCRGRVVRSCDKVLGHPALKPCKREGESGLCLEQRVWYFLGVIAPACPWLLLSRGSSEGSGDVQPVGTLIALAKFPKPKPRLELHGTHWVRGLLIAPAAVSPWGRRLCSDSFCAGRLVSEATEKVQPVITTSNQ